MYTSKDWKEANARARRTGQMLWKTSDGHWVVSNNPEDVAGQDEDATQVEVEDRVEARVKVHRYHDPKNLYPRAELYWEGPGWYASHCAGDRAYIVEVSYLIDEEESPYPITRGSGYGTAMWAETPEEAAGNYAGHEVA